MSKNTKLQSKQKVTSAKKTEYVRIAIDERLANIIAQIQAEYPLLSKAEAVKVVLSRGVKNRQKFINFINTLPQPKIKISEEEGFKILNEVK